MGKLKEIDTKLKELRRSITRRRPFKVSFNEEEIKVLVRDRRGSGRTDQSDEDMVHSNQEH